MKRATVTEAKNGLSALLDQVKAGETIVIVERGRPVAHLVPAQSRPESDDDRIARLERAGIIRPSRNPAGVAEFLKTWKPVKLPPGSPSAVQMLLEERNEAWY